MTRSPSIHKMGLETQAIEVRCKGATKPESIPAPPSEDGTEIDPLWLIREVAKGNLPTRCKRRRKEVREYRSKHPLENFNKGLAPDATLGGKGYTSPEYVDATCSEEDWKTIHQAFNVTGVASELVKFTGLSRPKVNHLLHRGVMRLGLPPISTFATDYAEVNLRVQKYLEASCTKLENTAMVEHAEEVKVAVTNRAGREAIAAQGLLGSVMESAECMLDYTQQLVKRIKDPDGGFIIPDKIDLGTLKTLVEGIDKLSSAMDKAVRLSRLTAGEPEKNIALDISIMVNRLSTEELQSYLTTGTLPRQLIAGGQLPDLRDLKAIDATYKEVK